MARLNLQFSEPQSGRKTKGFASARPFLLLITKVQKSDGHLLAFFDDGVLDVEFFVKDIAVVGDTLGGSSHY